MTEQSEQNEGGEAGAGTFDPAPQHDRTEASSHEDHVAKNLLIIGVLALIVVVLALLYVWGSVAQLEEELAPELPALDPVQAAWAELGTSTDVEAIEADLENTELEPLDAELDQLMTELDAAVGAGTE